MGVAILGRQTLAANVHFIVIVKRPSKVCFRGFHDYCNYVSAYIYSTKPEVFVDKEVRGRAQTGEGGKLASRRNKKARDFTHPFIHKSTLLSRGCF